MDPDDLEDGHLPADPAYTLECAYCGAFDFEFVMDTDEYGTTIHTGTACALCGSEWDDTGIPTRGPRISFVEYEAAVRAQGRL